MKLKRFVPAFFACISVMPCAWAQQGEVSFKTLLKKMSDVSALPELTDTKNELSSTWDRNGGNNDGADFKNLSGNYNVLLDVDGPGAVLRIFTGIVAHPINEAIDLNRTHLQIFIDNQEKPVIDFPVKDFFSKNTFTGYPFVFGGERTYPGLLLPIPYKKHIKVQLYSLDEVPVFEQWGNFWQVSYVTYPPNTPVKSFSLPLSASEKELMEQTGKYLIEAEKANNLLPRAWAKSISYQTGRKNEHIINGEGVIESLCVDVQPNTPEALKDIRLRIYWDKAALPSVDVPLGYFFGNADHASRQQFGSLLLGVDTLGGYSRFPMPFKKQAKLELYSPKGSPAKNITLKFNFKKTEVPANWGYFHATWTEQWATEETKRPNQRLGELNIPAMPKYGKRNVPVHIALDRNGFKGKYVGLLLHVAWPSKNWWGEGDVLIWADDKAWPPKYHGTGTEEYFNSGWGDFDRKAASGYIKKGVGNILVYTFHLNDAFDFKQSIKVGLERWNVFTADDKQKCIWGSTAFWYAARPQPAMSKQELLHPRLRDDDSENFKEVWE